MERSSRIRTRIPLRTRASVRFEPMKPAPPVTRHRSPGCSAAWSVAEAIPMAAPPAARRLRCATTRSPGGRAGRRVQLEPGVATRILRRPRSHHHARPNLAVLEGHLDPGGVTRRHGGSPRPCAGVSRSGPRRRWPVRARRARSGSMTASRHHRRGAGSVIAPDRRGAASRLPAPGRRGPAWFPNPSRRARGSPSSMRTR